MPEIRIMNYIDKYAALSPGVPAIISLQKTFTYAQLQNLVRETEQWFFENGLRSCHRIASLLSDNFDTSCAFFAISGFASFIPLNPDCTHDELLYYLQLLKIEVLLVRKNPADPVKKFLEKMGISLIRWEIQEKLKPEILNPGYKRPGVKVRRGPANLNDIALILYTSGTTAKPKVIPRSHINLCAAAENSARSYWLTDSDRHFTMTPVYYTASVLAMLASICVGGSFAVSGNLEISKLPVIFDKIKPTWLGASPAVFQSIADETDHNGIFFTKSSLRFLRSTGAPLSPQLVKRLENIFKVPIVNTYGLTETGIIACDYQVPKKGGSVGVVIGETGIMNENGVLLPNCSEGEIVVRGPSIISHYENNIQADKITFREGWFKTGDYGFIDEEGYLFVTGRIKELINRGGQKISPYEVEKFILQHPDVLDAVIFPFPHPRLGEEIAATLALKKNTSMTLKQLALFLNDKISRYKMPSRLFLVDRIPIGPAGKVQRNSMHQYFKSVSAPKNPNGILKPVSDEMEQIMVKIWQKLLKVQNIGVQDDFFELGGDSLLLARLYGIVEEKWNRKIDIGEFYHEATIEKLVKTITQDRNEQTEFPFLVPIQTKGSKTPIFIIHALGGEVLEYYKFAPLLGEDQPIYGLRFQIKSLPKLLSIEKLASYYIQDIRHLQPSGPYLLAGHSLGGVIAFEIARQLKNVGEDVIMLAMFDTELKKFQLVRDWGNRRVLYIKLKFKNISREKIKNFLNRLYHKQTREQETLIKIWRNYKPDYYSGKILYFAAEENDLTASSIEIWSKLADSMKIIGIKANHNAIMNEPIVNEVVLEMIKYMNRK